MVERSRLRVINQSAELMPASACGFRESDRPVGAIWEVGVGMTELEFDAVDVSVLADAGLVDPATRVATSGAGTPSSSPLHRAAARLQAVLPSGWQVDIDRATPRLHDDPQPVLRVTAVDN